MLLVGSGGKPAIFISKTCVAGPTGGRQKGGGESLTIRLKKRQVALKAGTVREDVMSVEPPTPCILVRHFSGMSRKS